MADSGDVKYVSRVKIERVSGPWPCAEMREGPDRDEPLSGRTAGRCGAER